MMRRLLGDEGGSTISKMIYAYNQECIIEERESILLHYSTG